MILPQQESRKSRFGLLGICKSDAEAPAMEEQKENAQDDDFNGRSVFDGSMSSIGSSAGVDGLYSPQQLTSGRGGGGMARASADGNLALFEDRTTEARVKFMCSFGGRIIPRPFDGKLRYVGGETRILSVSRDASYAEIMAKICEIWDLAIVLKYQMPDEDLDALVSVCNDEDLENMMEEYDRLELSDGGSTRLRAFLFPALVCISEESLEDSERTEASEGSSSKLRGFVCPVAEYDISCFLDPGQEGHLEQQYIDAVNGVNPDSWKDGGGGGGGERVESGDSSDQVSREVFTNFSPPRVACWTTRQPLASCFQDHANVNMEAADLEKLDVSSETAARAVSSQEQRTDVAPSSSSGEQQQQQFQKAEILQLYPKDDESPRLPVFVPEFRPEEVLHQQQHHHSSPMHEEAAAAYGGLHHHHHADSVGAYLQRLPSHFANVSPPHLCHGLPPPYHIPSSPAACFGYPRRCICSLPQFQQVHVANGRPPFSNSDCSQVFGRPQFINGATHCAGFHNSPPCCCEHSSDGRSIWWRQCHSCLNCDLLVQSLNNAAPPPPPVQNAAEGTTFFHNPQRQEQVVPFGLHQDRSSPQTSEQDGRIYDSPPNRYQAATPSKALNGWGGHLILGSETDHTKTNGQSDFEAQHHRTGFVTSAHKKDPGDVLVVSSSLVMNSVATRVSKSPVMKSLLSTSIHQAAASSSAVCVMSEAVQQKTLEIAAAEEQSRGKEDEHKRRSATLQTWEKPAEADAAPAAEAAKSNIAAAQLENQENTASAAEKEAISRGLQTIKNGDLEEIRQLGTGTFGTVFYGKWRGSEVAIKRIKPSCFAGRPAERDRLIADFWREACTLGQLHHPNVVAFYGVVPDGPEGTLATVTEYMVNGSLKQVLHRKDRTIDRRKRLLIAMDAAIGMEYLHEKKIVHFDLKCENLLVNMRDPHRPICKVGDFGLSKVKHQTMVSGGVRGTLPWMAPELLNGSSSMVTEKVDIFSFGIVMWELLTGEEPYANMHYGAIIGGIVSNTLRPVIPDWCEPSWKSLMERCWGADQIARPSFAEVAADLRTMSATPLQPKTQN